MTESSFIELLLNKGIIEINDEGDDYKRPWEVEQAKKFFTAFSQIGDLINSNSNFNPQIVVEAFILGAGHRTLEQSMMRMMLTIMEQLAERIQDPENTDITTCDFTDPRNRSGRQMCWLLVKLFEEHKGEGAKPSQYLGSI